MAPAIEPGDWLLVDPTTAHWPRRGTVVVFQEPDGGGLAVKRVAAGPGVRVAFAQGYLELAEDEAWLLSDATTETAAERGFGKDRFEFQMLYGIRRDLQSELSSEGYTVRLYIPFGREWFPYFMRRLGERPANLGFVMRGILREK